MDVRVKLGDSMISSGRIIRLFAGRIVLRTCVQYLIAFCYRPETDSDVLCSRFVAMLVPDQ